MALNATVDQNSDDAKHLGAKAYRAFAKQKIWFQRPSRNLSLLKERQDAVSFLLNPCNVEVANILHDSLKHIRNVPRILKLMEHAQASVSDWQALYKTAFTATNIRDVSRAQPQDIAIFRKISEAFTDDVHYVASLISKIIDFDESADLGRFVVKQNVDSELDKRKRTYNGLPDLMTRVAREEINRLSEDIEQCNVIYLPQLGYLLAIPCTQDMVDHENYDIPGLEFVFMSNNTVHYKSERTKALDAKLGDTQCEITDHETEIMHKLQNIILERADVFVSVMEYAAELDCLLAFATAAKDNNYICPSLTQENIIDIQGGRHPLQEMCVSPFVPNNTKSSATSSKVKFLTGPNASGKSVYLKQVGLICFMAHIGSFVPAEAATIGMMDAIFTRIHTQESVSVGLSTFMIDLNQMSFALQSATHLSLVIIDEFGKGTDVADGSALLVACLKHWLEKKSSCPHLFISTHFHSIVKQNLLPESPLLSYQTMEVLDNEGEMVFLYQLIEGHANYSYASHIATLAGIPEELVMRGKEVADLIKHNKPIHRADSSDTQYLLYKEIASDFMDADLDTLKIDEFLQERVLDKVMARVV